MARVLMATQPWGLIQDSAGNVQVGEQVTFTNPDASPATHWSAATAGTSSTAAVTADSRGRLMRWIDVGTYNQTVAGETLEVHAVASSGVQGLQGLPGNTGADGQQGPVGPAGGTALTIVSKTANFTLAAADAGKYHVVSSAGAVVVSVPKNSDVSIPVGSVYAGVRSGAGSVTFDEATDVTLTSTYDFRVIARQGSEWSLKKIATDAWVLGGDLA